jgi:hypothetical protein
VLAAGVLFSAGSAHHRHGHHAEGGHSAVAGFDLTLSLLGVLRV